MTEQELISKLQGLKQIKPNAQWVSLSKNNIFIAKPEVLKPASQWNFSNILGLMFQKKLAYAFAVLLFAVVGIAGVLQIPGLNGSKVASEKSTAALIAQNTLKNNVEEFKVKSQILADVVKSNYQNPDMAKKDVKDVAGKITIELQKNPELAKVVALDINNNKTLLDIPGGNDAVEVTDIYKTIDEQLIADLEKVTLTEDQQKEFARIKKAYDDGGDYATILRDILLMNISRDTKVSEDSKK